MTQPADDAAADAAAPPPAADAPSSSSDDSGSSSSDAETERLDDDASPASPANDSDSDADCAAAAPAAAATAAGPGAAGPSAAAAAAEPARSAGGFRFVSYRDAVRGHVGDRKARHWLLRDNKGAEHVAVDTTGYSATAKRFYYAAVAPFAAVRPFRGKSSRDVAAYLDQFVPPEARGAGSLAAEELAGAPAAPPPEVALPAGAPPAAAAAKKAKAAAATAAAKRKRAEGAALAAATLPQAAAPAAAPALALPPICGGNAGAAARLGAVAAELAALRAEHSVEYALTLVAPDRAITVLTSGAAAAGGGGGCMDGGGLDGAGGSGAPTPALANGGGAARPARAAPLKREESLAGEGGPARAAPGARKRLKGAPADARVAALLAAAADNALPFLPGAWQRKPFPRVPLERLAALRAAPDCGEAADAAALPAKLACAVPRPPGAPDAPGEGDNLIVLSHLPPALPEADLELAPTWGLDSWTRRLLADALAAVGAFPTGDAGAADEFLARALLPALNAAGDGGWDVLAACAAVEAAHGAGRPGARAGWAAAAAALAAAADAAERHLAGGGGGAAAPPPRPDARRWFRAHPKGDGVLLARRAGLGAGAFVGQYLGEVYCAWRWAERAAAARERRGAASARMGASAEVANIALERPAADRAGAEALFVDATARGSPAARLGHSCEPNCRAAALVAGGRLTIGVWTTRAVARGEELTLDHGGEAESEREAREAVCLCGAAACRGAYLYPPPGPASPLAALLAERHGLLERCALLARAGAEPHLSFEDAERLARHGVRDALLTDGGRPAPGWLRRWAALALEFVEAEAAELPARLAAAGEEAPAEEAAHLRRERLQALALALDRAKLTLRHQPEGAAAAPPLCALGDAEARDFLWTGADSVARRALGALGAFAEQAGSETLTARRGSRRSSGAGVEGAGRRRAGASADGEGGSSAELEGREATAARLEALHAEAEALIEAEPAPATAAAARAALRGLAERLGAAGPAHAGARDVLCLYAATRAFLARAEYVPFSSALAGGGEGARYRPAALWAALALWHRAPPPDGVEALMRERRGVVALPDPETLYMPALASGRYASPGGERAALARHLAAAPRAPWPAKLCEPFTFRDRRVFGSPQLDAALGAGAPGAAAAALAEAPAAA
jgi:hypothetical protein